MRDSSALEISYQIPPSCSGLAFVNKGISPYAAAELRKDWTPANDCTLVDNNQLRPAHAACTNLRVRVPASRLALDRIYPWAFPFDRGLYLHTMSYAVTGACGPVNWRFTVPAGTVVADGMITAVTAERSAATGGADYTPVILLQEAPGDERLHIDAGFTEQGKIFLNETFAAVERELRAMLPDLPFTMPYTLATVAPEGETSGDVANLTIMRLHLPLRRRPSKRFT